MIQRSRKRFLLLNPRKMGVMETTLTFLVIPEAKLLGPSSYITGIGAKLGFTTPLARNKLCLLLNAMQLIGSVRVIDPGGMIHFSLSPPRVRRRLDGSHARSWGSSCL